MVCGPDFVVPNAMAGNFHQEANEQVMPLLQHNASELRHLNVWNRWKLCISFQLYPSPPPHFGSCTNFSNFSSWFRNCMNIMNLHELQFFQIVPIPKQELWWSATRRDSLSHTFVSDFNFCDMKINKYINTLTYVVVLQRCYWIMWYENMVTNEIGIYLKNMLL